MLATNTISNKAEESSPNPIISLKDVHKTFGKDNQVLKGLNLTVNKGENLVMIGRSGSGKSVVIKSIIGLIHPDAGEISVFDTNMTNLSETDLNQMRKKIGFLFQSAALYDSMSVRENLAFPLIRNNKKLSLQSIDDLINQALNNVGLLEAIHKMPAELSGGMRKRIGLARTLILQPSIILYDEPTTGLDTITAKEISNLILQIQSQQQTTAIIITHDIQCAKIVGNRIVLLQDGIIGATGTYEELANSSSDWIRAYFE